MEPLPRLRNTTLPVSGQPPAPVLLNPTNIPPIPAVTIFWTLPIVVSLLLFIRLPSQEIPKNIWFTIACI